MITIPGSRLRQIATAAERAYPEECCGLLIGHRQGAAIVVNRVAESPNVVAGSRRDRFEVDPALRFRLMRELAAGTEQIIGHYHSHPDLPAEPSAHDMAMAFEPELVWLIIAVDAGRAGAVGAFRLDAARRRFAALPLRITPDETTVGTVSSEDRS